MDILTAECAFCGMDTVQKRKEQKAMIDMSKKYITKHGEPVRILYTDLKGSWAPIVGIVTGLRGGIEYEYANTFREEELIEAKTKHSRWVVMYKHCGQVFGVVYSTKEHAKEEQAILNPNFRVLHEQEISWEE